MNWTLENLEFILDNNDDFDVCFDLIIYKLESSPA